MVPTDTLTAGVIFRKLPPKLCEQIALHAELLTFEEGTILYRQGDPSSGLFTLQSGQVKLYRKSREKAQILEIDSAGDSFGAESFYNNAPSPWTAEAIQAGSAIHIPPDGLSSILAEHPDFSLVLLELISKKLRSFTGLVHSLAFRDVTARLAEVLLAQAQKTPQTGSPSRIERILSQQDLAAMVGTAREVIYRTLKKFEQEGILQVTPTHIIILDIDQLQAIANQETH